MLSRAQQALLQPSRAIRMETDMTTDMRTDIELRCDVLDEMDDEAILAVHRIDVAVKDGIVFLMGQVESFIQKSAAERVAYRATGRRAMATGLSIKRRLRASGDGTGMSEVRGSLEHDPDKIHRTLE